MTPGNVRVGLHLQTSRKFDSDSDQPPQVNFKDERVFRLGKALHRPSPSPNSLHLPSSSAPLAHPTVRLDHRHCERHHPTYATSTIARVSSRPLTSGHAFRSCLSRFSSTLRLQTTNCGTLSSSRCPRHTFSMPALAVLSYSCVSPFFCYAQHDTKFFYPHPPLLLSVWDVFALHPGKGL